MKQNSDDLEHFIAENRAQFDDAAPNPEVWNAVQQDLPIKTPFNWWKVACLILLLAVSVLVGKQYYGNKIEQKQHLSLSAELSSVEDFYIEQINEKTTLFYDHEQSEHVPLDFELEIQRLDAMYLVLKEEFHRKPSKEVLEAMTLNLIVRMNILNDALSNAEKKVEDALEEQITI